MVGGAADPRPADAAPAGAAAGAPPRPGCDHRRRRRRRTQRDDRVRHRGARTRIHDLSDDESGASQRDARPSAASPSRCRGPPAASIATICSRIACTGVAPAPQHRRATCGPAAASGQARARAATHAVETRRETSFMTGSSRIRVLDPGIDPAEPQTRWYRGNGGIGGSGEERLSRRQDVSRGPVPRDLDPECLPLPPCSGSRVCPRVSARPRRGCPAPSFRRPGA